MQVEYLPMELQRLLEEERKAVTECRDTVAQWEKFHDDYQALEQRLTTLPDHIKHDVMVPIGKHAFMPGHLYHTNEITVLLGDNWFAQVTAKQARDIVNRRQKVVEEKLSDAKRQLKDIEAKLAFTESFHQQDAVEIKEELGDSKLPVSKKRIAHTRKTPSVVKAAKKKPQMDDDELWKRLDALEQQEQEDNEQEHNGRQEETNIVVTATDPVGTSTNVINISHTSLPMADNSNRTCAGIINSPADICVNQSMATSAFDSAVQMDPTVKSKSVHWSSDVTSQENPTVVSSTPRIKPFTGSVIEKESQTVTSTDTGRKMSRFKASRQT